MSCKITKSTPAEVKIDILLTIEAMNQYRRDHYGMNSCKIGYDWKYLMDMRDLLKYTACAECAGKRYCNCSYTSVKERINTL